MLLVLCGWELRQDWGKGPDKTLNSFSLSLTQALLPVFQGPPCYADMVPALCTHVKSRRPCEVTMASAGTVIGVVLCRHGTQSLSDSRGTVITCASTAGRFGHGMLSPHRSPEDNVMLCHGKWRSCSTESTTKCQAAKALYTHACPQQAAVGM